MAWFIGFTIAAIIGFVVLTYFLFRLTNEGGYFYALTFLAAGASWLFMSVAMRGWSADYLSSELSGQAVFYWLAVGATLLAAIYIVAATIRRLFAKPRRHQLPLTNTHPVS